MKVKLETGFKFKRNYSNISFAPVSSSSSCVSRLSGSSYESLDQLKDIININTNSSNININSRINPL